MEDQLARDSLQYKRDWFNHNGGSTTRDPKDYEKPTFFNIALNYVPLNMDQLLQKAGKESLPPAPAPSTVSSKAAQAENTIEKKAVPRTKVEESRPETPESEAPTRGGISSLLGAWWGRS